MAYRHGVYISEIPTSILPPVEAEAGLPVIVGRAPINLASSLEYVNKPILCYNYTEAVAALGYCKDWKNYELAEAIKVMFQLYAVAPIVFINVLDPKVHKKEKENIQVVLVKDEVHISEQGILLDTIQVKLSDTTTNLTENEDYMAAFDKQGGVVISGLPGGKITAETTSLSVSYSQLAPEEVTQEDIIGGVDALTGEATGLEIMNQIFPLFRLVPGQILAPRWSKQVGVAAVMKAKASTINGVFKATPVCDLDSSVGGADRYSEVPAWKENNGYCGEHQINCWPLLKLGDEIYNFSSHYAAVACRTDAANGDIPYYSPSNQSLQINGLVNEAGKEIILGPDTAAYLNGNGIVTGLNFTGGWKLWGNRTGAYPGNSDPKDSWIAVRRMFNWIANSIVLTYWQKVDNPTNIRLIRTMVDSMNIWLNGLAARGAILGGRLEFQEEENPITDLLNGAIRFHLYLGTPIPAEDLEFVLEYDVSYLSTLFAA